MKIFRINNRVEVYHPEEKVYYKSLIQEVDKDSITIGVPMRGRQNLNLEKGSTWKFRVTWEDGQYYFSSEVIERKVGDRVPLYVIKRPQEVRRQQRRSFYRFPCALEADYELIESQDGKGYADLDSPLQERETFSLRGTVVDLSGGGAQIVTRKYHPPGAALAMHLYLNGEKSAEILVQGRVVRCVPYKRGGRRYYRIGVEFTGISELTRDKLISYIFTCLCRRPT